MTRHSARFHPHLCSSAFHPHFDSLSLVKLYSFSFSFSLSLSLSLSLASFLVCESSVFVSCLDNIREDSPSSFNLPTLFSVSFHVSAVETGVVKGWAEGLPRDAWTLGLVLCISRVFLLPFFKPRLFNSAPFQPQHVPCPSRFRFVRLCRASR